METQALALGAFLILSAIIFESEVYLSMFHSGRGKSLSATTSALDAEARRNNFQAKSRRRHRPLKIRGSDYSKQASFFRGYRFPCLCRILLEKR